MDFEQAGGISSSTITLGNDLSDLGLLLRRQPWTASANAAVLASSIQTGIGSSLSMARSNSAKAPIICIIIRPATVVVIQRQLPEPLHNRKHVAEGAGQPVEFPDHEHIALAKLIEQPAPQQDRA